METTIKNTEAQNVVYASEMRATRAKTLKAETAYDRWISKLHFSYFGIISMTVLIGSIIGGVSAMYILKNDAPVWQLGLCMATAMANNVAAIGQAPTKWVVNLFLTCVGVNALLILLNIF